MRLKLKNTEIKAQKNQKLSDYFHDKKEDFEKQGREDYILTSDEVENYSPNEVKKTFGIFDEDEDENTF